MFEAVRKNLEALGYTVSCFSTSAEAVSYLDGAIDKKTVGIGGSMTVAEMGLCPALQTHNEVYWHQFATDPAQSLMIRKKAAEAEIYISSVNGLSEKGEIINIDGNCNRVASVLYGHQKVYLIIGKNKLEKDYDRALWRARNIAAPLNAKRLNKQTPCVAGGRCYDCKSPARICRGLSVLWSKPTGCDYEIVLIDESLGY